MPTYPYVTQVVHGAARSRPDQPCLIYGERRTSNAQFRDRVARLAGGLLAAGVRPGDRVAIIALNSDRFVESFFGCFWAGAAAAPLNVRWTPHARAARHGFRAGLRHDRDRADDHAAAGVLHLRGPAAGQDQFHRAGAADRRGRDQGSRGPRGPARDGRRADRSQPQRHARLLRQPRADRRHRPRRLAVQRRWRLHGLRRVHPPGGPDQGHDHHRRRERLLHRGGDGARQPPRGGHVRGHRRAPRHLGRAGARRGTALPMSAAGKILKTRLRAEYAKQEAPA